MLPSPIIWNRGLLDYFTVLYMAKPFAHLMTDVGFDTTFLRFMLYGRVCWAAVLDTFL